MTLEREAKTHMTKRLNKIYVSQGERERRYVRRNSKTGSDNKFESTYRQEGH